jgi:hypothetical protein
VESSKLLLDCHRQSLYKNKYYFEKRNSLAEPSFIVTEVGINSGTSGFKCSSVGVLGTERNRLKSEKLN